MTTKDYFPDVIGQESAKAKLGFRLDNYEASGILPNLLFIAPKGCGKTMLAEEMAKNLKGSDGRIKPFIGMNCGGFRNVKQFIGEFYVPRVVNREVTVLFDECHALKNDISTQMLSMFESGRTVNNVLYEDYNIEVDFSRQSFMFATTEAHKIFHALKDRCTRIDLEPYEPNELSAILQLKMKGYSFGDGVLDSIGSILRDNPREATNMAKDLASFMMRSNEKNVTKEAWDDFQTGLRINPMGLFDNEVKILKALSQQSDLSLTNVSAKVGMSPQAIRQDYEMYLQKQGLMVIKPSGRSITRYGREMLEYVEWWKGQLPKSK
jgi:Holliday junction resolvasome RuvABC ATP-dependent DNA helicase subunit